MIDVAWELFKSPLMWVMLICLIGGTAYIAYTEHKESKK